MWGRTPIDLRPQTETFYSTLVGSVLRPLRILRVNVVQHQWYIRARDCRPAVPNTALRLPNHQSPLHRRTCTCNIGCTAPACGPSAPKLPSAQLSRPTLVDFPCVAAVIAQLFLGAPGFGIAFVVKNPGVVGTGLIGGHRRLPAPRRRFSTGCASLHPCRAWPDRWWRQNRGNRFSAWPRTSRQPLRGPGSRVPFRS